MSRRKRALGILGAAIVATGLASCDSGTSSTVSINYPKVKFVGNDTCPTTVQVTPGASPTPQQPSPYLPSPPQVNGDHIVGQAIDEMPHFHVDPSLKVQYNHDPPTSGCHYSIANQAPVPPGAYNQEIPAEYWVHNLEHGYVVVLFNCPTGCDSDFQKLVQWRKGLPPDPAGNGQIPYAKVVVLPWHTMPVKFAAVSWDYYQGWDSLDISKVQAFYDNHVGHAPEGAMTG